jgi:hypothetical protein
MGRHIGITLVPFMIVLASGWTSLARAAPEAEVEEWTKTQINERLYDSCRTVRLRREEVEVYQGFAEFINGQRSTLTVTVSDSGVTYKFGKSRPVGIDPNTVQFNRLEVVIGRQKMEIARLEGLCRRAGLDPQAPAANAEHPPAESPSQRADVQQPTTDTARGPEFTRGLYEKIEKGMTCAQVTDLLGSPGEQTSGSSFDGATNEMRVWMNPDDSHICIVFRNGAVLVKTESGLNSLSSRPERTPAEAHDLQNWRLAQPTDGRPVPLNLLLGQWLRDIQEALTRLAGEPAQVDAAEEGDQIIVDVAYKDRERTPHHVQLYLTCLPLQETGSAPAQAGTAERICVPSRLCMDGKEQDDPAQAWRVLRQLTGGPESPE